MSARTPRRTFANPFVITLAATGCYAQTGSPPPHQPRPQVAHGDHDHSLPHTNPPPPPYQEPIPTTVENPPRPTTTPTPAPPATPPTDTRPAPGTVVLVEQTQPKPGTFNYDQRWHVMKRGATCQAMAKVECPKPTKQGGPMPTCNPPPPMKYACPPNMTEPSLTIVQYAGATDCVIEPKAAACPPPGGTPGGVKVMCNPPRPQKVACPKY